MMKSSPVIVLSGAGGGMPAPAPFRAGSGCLPGLRGAPYPLRLARILFGAIRATSIREGRVAI